jgi:glycosyltransferase involved in cell wall biosynthesis
MNLVSVVIPTRGRPDLVVRAVASARAQTHTSLEIVVVVDGPDPATEAALGAIDDPRLSVITLPGSVGAAEARNVGVRAGIGEWVAFLDDDDEWLPPKLERQLASVGASGVATPIAFCPIVIRTDGTQAAWRSRPPARGEHPSEYLFVRRSLRFGEGTVGTSTIVAQRALLREIPFDVSLRRYQDADWILRATAAGAQLVYCPERLSIWTAPGDRPSITAAHATEWRDALGWIRARRALVTPRAYASFILVRVSGLASTAGDRSAIGELWVEARRHGRAGPLDVAIFAARWVVPSGLRRWLRRRTVGVRTGVRPT